MTTGTPHGPLLPGIGISGYRSFGMWQTLEFQSKVTVLAGINNSGKSNVLRFLQEKVPKLRSAGGQPPGRVDFDELDVPRGLGAQPIVRVGVPLALGPIEPSQDPLRNNGQVHPQDLASFRRAAQSLLEQDHIYWSIFERGGNSWECPAERVEKAMNRWPKWQNYYRSVVNTIGGTVDPKDVMKRLLEGVGGFENLPSVATISSARRVEATDANDGADWLSGRGIVRELAALQNPPHGGWNEGRARWAAINKFIRTIIEDNDASINIPYDFSTIQVETPDRVLPLGSLGSGIEQVIVLAAAATVTTRQLVCIEEPETNLHPLLQKKLIRYLTDETDNQYVIATHSSHLLDDARATAYHLRLTRLGTVARRARKPHELVNICNDLGYRPSDLMQANCVVWVEGPSDRIYVRHWLRLAEPSLAEGIDYSIMFYGGKLLAHLTVNDEALQDFIELRQLNRASAVIIDSDKTSARANITKTKRRIRDEFAASSPALGFAWVTNCYTVENYIPDDLLRRALNAVHPRRKLNDAGQWVNPLHAETGEPSFDKIAIARAVEQIQNADDLDRYDLRQRIADLVNFIREANGKSVAPAGD